MFRELSTRLMQQSRLISSQTPRIPKNSNILTKATATNSIIPETAEPSKPQQPWRPVKRVSRITMDKIRTLAATQPEYYKIEKLSEEFKISREAVKRILKSNWAPSKDELARQEKKRYAAMGKRKEEIKKGTYSRFMDTTTPSQPPSFDSSKKSSR